MATQRQKEALYLGLRKKYWTKSDTQLVGRDVLDDMNAYKKYEILNLDEMVEVFLWAVCELDGWEEDFARELWSEDLDSGDLRELFLTDEELAFAEKWAA